MSRIDELTDRIERLLLRHEELRRTNDLLAQQVTVVTQERDSLRARLAAARGRIDALLDKLPPPPTTPPEAGAGTLEDRQASEAVASVPASSSAQRNGAHSPYTQHLPHKT